MRLSRIWVLASWAAIVGSTAALAAVVYKWTDADGVVHYSDQPVPGAEKIVTSTGPKGIGGAIPNAGPAEPDKAKSKLTFSQFAITSPGAEETITGNQPVLVHLALAPELSSTQSVTWFLNGQPLTNQAPDAVQFSLSDLPRGTYSIMATVADQGTGESRSSESVTFYVVRPSVLSPQHK